MNNKTIDILISLSIVGACLVVVSPCVNHSIKNQYIELYKQLEKKADKLGNKDGYADGEEMKNVYYKMGLEYGVDKPTLRELKNYLKNN